MKQKNIYFSSLRYGRLTLTDLKDTWRSQQMLNVGFSNNFKPSRLNDLVDK